MIEKIYAHHYSASTVSLINMQNVLANFHHKHKRAAANSFKEVFNLNLHNDTVVELKSRFKAFCDEWRGLIPLT